MKSKCSRENKRKLENKLFKASSLTLTLISFFTVIMIFTILLVQSKPLIMKKPLSEFLTVEWAPHLGKYGLATFMASTLFTTAIAMAISIPPCILTAIYLAEFSTPKVKEYAKSMIDLLAGIPSVVYGLWGVIFIVPIVRDRVAPPISEALGFIPVFSAQNNSGYSVIASGMVLAIMVTPIIVSVSYEVITYVPFEYREASLALGSTKWEAVKKVVLREAAPGIAAAVVLGFCRAFGETMAVLMVAGCVAKTPTSIFDPCYPLTALIANNYGEMLSIPEWVAALSVAGLILMLIVLVFNVVARIVVIRTAGE